jgi:hypothetical protein
MAIIKKEQITEDFMMKMLESDYKDFNKLPESDLISLIGFWKFLSSDCEDPEGAVYVTPKGSLVYNHLVNINKKLKPKFKVITIKSFQKIMEERK